MQFSKEDGERFVAATDENGRSRRLRGAASVLELAGMAAESDVALSALAVEMAEEEIDAEKLFAEGRALSPIDHPDSARLMISGTGLTHIASAQARDQMHDSGRDDLPQTDSIRMFNLGMAGGKPPPDVFFGAQPEWFYKGDGRSVVPPGGEIERPAFAEDGGEEAEIAGVYFIDSRARPRRIGFALGNEFSDHAMEKQNYLWLAHSKLRQCALGPELLVGELPKEVHGRVSVRRGGKTLWEKEFLSGEDHMCHSIANLERHHFKYGAFRRPGDAHVHFFGTATLSFADKVRTEDGDEFAIECPIFGRPLINRMRAENPARRDEALPL